MIEVNYNYITKYDIEEVLKINPNEYDLGSCFVTDGYTLYYVDGYTFPREIRALSDVEQYQNLPIIAKYMGMSEKEFISHMLKQNKDIDYKNIGNNEFNTKEEVDKWWQNQSNITIYKVYDKHYGIGELIADI